MPPVTRKRNLDQPVKAKQNGKNEPGTRPAATKRARVAAKASKVVKPRREGAGAFEEDIDDRESMPSAMNAAKGIKETKMEMRRKAGETTKLMKKQLMKESLGIDIQAFAETFPPEIASVLHDDMPGNNDNRTFQKAQQCLANLENLVRGYEDLNKCSMNMQAPARAHWDQDEADLKALSESAMRAAFGILNSIVMPCTGDDVIEFPVRAAGSSDIDIMAAELLAEARPQREDVTWGKTARDLSRALSGAMELLPEAQRSLGGHSHARCAI